MTELLNITAVEYHLRTEVSNSSLKVYAGFGSKTNNGPHTYHEKYVSKTMPADERSDAMRFGSGFHIAFEYTSSWADRLEIIPSVITEDETLEYVLDNLPKKSTAKIPAPGVPINTQRTVDRQYLQIKKDEAEAAGKGWVTEDESESICGMLQAIVDNPGCREVLEADECLREQAAIGTDDKTQLPIRALADIWQPNLRCIWDVKTTCESIPYGFAYDSHKRKYHLQLAFYRRVFNWERAGLIGVTSTRPYIADIFEFDEREINAADESIDRALTNLKASHDFDVWTPAGYGTQKFIGQHGRLDLYREES